MGNHIRYSLDRRGSQWPYYYKYTKCCILNNVWITAVHVEDITKQWDANDTKVNVFCCIIDTSICNVWLTSCDKRLIIR